mgnify:CR=1 FL=1
MGDLSDLVLGEDETLQLLQLANSRRDPDELVAAHIKCFQVEQVLYCIRELGQVVCLQVDICQIWH